MESVNVFDRVNEQEFGVFEGFVVVIGILWARRCLKKEERMKLDS